MISGFEEARLIHLGVLQALPVFDKRLLMVDIGGGSTELLIVRGGNVIHSGSYRLGSLRLLRMLESSRSGVSRKRSLMEGHIRRAVSQIAEQA